MTQKQNSRCNCCGLSISDDSSNNCPRCGYPILPSKEIEFLESSIKTLADVVANGGGKAQISGLTSLSEATREELEHLAKYGGANLRLIDLLQFSPWVIEGLRRIKSPRGPEMRIPELIYILERSTQWLRTLTSQEWQQVQVAGVIQLSRSTIEQIQRIVDLHGSELRVAGIVQITPSRKQELQRIVDFVGTDIKTSELLDRYLSRLTNLREQSKLQTQEDQSKKTVHFPLSTSHSQPTGEITVQKPEAPEIAPPFTPSPVPAVTPPLRGPQPVTPPLIGVRFSLDAPARASEPAPTRGAATGPAPAPVKPEPPRRSQADRAHVSTSEKLKTFIVDSKDFITYSKMLLTLLGAFLSLMAALFLVVGSFTSRSQNTVIPAFVAVVFAQGVFLGLSIWTRRSTRFLQVARIYAFVFVLLIPMFGFELYKLLGGNSTLVSQQWLIALVALYTAISFCLFAIYQKYHPFSYLSTSHSQPIDEITVQKPEAPETAPPFIPSPVPAVTPPLPGPRPVTPPLVGVRFSLDAPARAGEPAQAPTRGAATGPAPAPVKPEPPRRNQADRARVSASEKRKTFIADSKDFITDSKMLLTLLGAFLSLMAALFLVVGTFTSRSPSNVIRAFVAVVFAQGVFLGLSIWTQRSTRFLQVARIYAFVFALLIPMFGFELYKLLSGNSTPVSPQWLIALVALYTAISFCLFAIYQKYHPFGYFGIVALWVAAIAMAQALNVGLEWYPMFLMLLTLPSLIAVRESKASATPDSDSTAIKVERLMAASPAVLRNPVKYCMYILVAFCSISIFPLALLSFNPGSADIISSWVQQAPITPGQAPFAMFCMFALLLIWYSLYLWLTKKQTGQIGIAWLFLASSLACGYSFQFSPLEYTFIFAGLAILYHIVGTRFIASAPVSASAPPSTRKLASLAKLALHLDQFALIFICIIPFTSAPVAIPLFFKGHVPVSLSAFSSYFQPYSPFPTLSAILALLALCSGIVLTVAIAIRRDAMHRIRAGVASAWPWLLLLAGLFLCWTYSVLIVNLPGDPAWWFLGLTLALVAITVIVRQRAASPSSSWANPLDIVVLCVAVTTILLNIQNSQAVSNLLLFFAALFYVVLLWQNRQKPLFLPLLFALFALPNLFGQLPAVSLSALIAASSILAHPPVLLLCAVTLPFVAALIHRLTAKRTPISLGATLTTIGWQWPVTCFSLLCACILLYHDGLAPWISSPVVPPAISIEIALLSLVWYGCAALTRAKWLLFPATAFSIMALLFNMSNFWPLAAIAVIAALAGLSISRLSSRIWATPLYTTALLSAFLTGVAGDNQAGLFLSWAAWALLGFVVIVHIVAIVEKQPPLLWLTPVLTTWSVIDTLIFQYSHITLFPQNLLDLARVPGVALVSVAVAVAIGLASRRANVLPVQINKRPEYTFPLYISALIAAIVTGGYALFLLLASPTTSALIAAVSLALPAFLLLYAAVVSAVALFERQARWLWFVAGFGIWGTLLTVRVNMYALVGTGIATGIVGLTMGMSRRLKVATATPLPDAIDRAAHAPLNERTLSIAGLGDALKSFTWSWPWYLITVVAAVVTGLYPSFSSIPANGAVAYSLLAFAAFIYSIGCFEKQTGIAFFAMGFSAWALLDLAGFNLFLFNFSSPASFNLFNFNFSLPLLLVLALLCAGIGVVIRLPGFRTRRLPAHTITGQKDRTLQFTLPVYLTALLAAILTGVAPYSLSVSLPVILLGYAIISYAVIVFERKPAWLFIPAGFAAWGTLLISQNTAVLIIGLLSAPIGMLIKQRMGRSVSAPGQPTIWQKLLHTWAWPWYLTTLIAAIITGLHPQITKEWLSPANSLLIFAALTYTIGLIEDLTVWLWIGSLLALWSLLDSYNAQSPDPLRLISMALICVTLGIIIRLSKSLFKQRAANLFIYALPCYITALVAAILTGMYGAGLRGTPGVPLVSQPLSASLAPTFYGAVLFLYALIAFVVLMYERHPAWLALVVAFGIWATVFVSFPAYVLAIGIASGVLGLFFRRVIRATPSSNALPASLQSLLQPFIRFAWAWPWYSILLVAAIATGITGIHTPTTAGWLSPATSLLVFAALTYIIGLVEGLTPSLWIGSLLALWSLLDSYNAQSPDPLRLISMALICVTLGIIIRLSKPLFKQRAANLFTYALPCYITALVAAILTGMYGMNAKTMSGIPLVSQYLPSVQPAVFYGIILLVYALLAFMVLVYEKLPLLLALVAAFGIWATVTVLVSSASPEYMLAIGIASGVFGLFFRRVIRATPSSNALPASLQSLLQPFIRFAWAWPWYSILLVAAIATGIHTPTTAGWLSPATSLLVFAALTYIIGLVEGLTPSLWIGALLALWSLLDSYNAQQPDPLRLISMAVICVTLGIIIRRSKSLFKQRAANLFTYALPCYITALVAAVLTGMYGMNAKTMSGIPLVSQYLPSVQPAVFYGIILLVYALIAFMVLVYEKLPLLLALVAAFGIWATVLVSSANPQYSPQYMLAIGMISGVLGLLLSRTMKATPSGMALPTSLQSLPQLFLRFTWSWPWYGIALMAAIIPGIAHPSGAENSLLLFAILAYVIGLVENQTGILYVALVLALWSASDSAFYNDKDLLHLLRLFLETICFVVVAIAISLYARRRFPHRKRDILFRYTLPLYALALCIAGLTAWIGATGTASTATLPLAGNSINAVCLALLFYTALAYGVLRFERWGQGMPIVALFGLWGTLLATRTNASLLLLLVVGLGAALVGIAHAWKAFARRSVPASSQLEETFNIDNI